MTTFKQDLFKPILVLAICLRVGLIAYGEYHDRHSDLKYTDIDYRVFSDATKSIVYGDVSQYGRLANGPLSAVSGLQVGDPYARDTYRYTPLLALLLIPNEIIHPIWGKVLFALSDIIIGVMLYATLLRSSALARPPQQKKDQDPSEEAVKSSAALWIGALWLLNPMVANISTRGSAESLLGLMVVSSLGGLMFGHETAAAVLFGLAVHFKIYPAIYAVSILASLAAQEAVRGRGLLGTGWAGLRQIKFAIVSGGTFLTLGLAMYGVFGYAFLEHTYLYHLGRRDHRHNFSLYFYPTYLSYPPAGSTPSAVSILSSPLLSFFPQMALSIGSGLMLTRGMEDLPFVWFVQTMIFVTFNKVCTSQYFMWSMWFLPLVLPRMKMTVKEAAGTLLLWVLGQAIWLAIAYRLELLGEQVFLPLWVASALFLVISTFVLVKLVQAYTVAN